MADNGDDGQVEYSYRQLDLAAATDDEIAAIGRLESSETLRLLGGVECRTVEQLRATLIDTPYRRLVGVVAESGSELVGYARGELSLQENTDWLSGSVLVAPKHRGKGVGSALARRLADAGRANGRERFELRVDLPISSDPDKSSAPVNRLARGLGLSRKSLAVARVAPIPLDPEVAAALSGRATDSARYSLVSWSGPMPEVYLEPMARLVTQLEMDDPTEEAEYEAPIWTPDRVRESDERAIAGGYLPVVCAALTQGGEMVGYSEVEVANSPHTTLARQGDTIVMPEHRGHRLGLAMKLQTHTSLPKIVPAVRRIDTWNSHVNDSMIAINEALGYRPVAWDLLFQN